MILRHAVATSVLASALLAAPSSLAIDVNKDGSHDARVREMPWLAPANVGSNCDVWQSNSPLHARLYVRPPVVSGLRALGRQRVAWRARFWDVGSNAYRHSGAWVTATTRPGKSVFFGGGPDAGNGVFITHRQYWNGSQWYDHFVEDGDRIKAHIEVGWYSRRKARWIIRSLPVNYVITTQNRTTGNGQTGPYSTPMRNYTC